MRTAIPFGVDPSIFMPRFDGRSASSDATGFAGNDATVKPVERLSAGMLCPDEAPRQPFNTFEELRRRSTSPYPAAWTLVLAVSRDGYLATKPNDDMKWTGAADKDLFRLLTLAGGPILLAGHKTWDLLPPLQGRQVVPLSTRDMTLHMAGLTWPTAVFIGGPTLALKAIAGGFVQRTILNEVQVDVEHLVEDKMWAESCPLQKDIVGALTVAGHRRVSTLHYTGPLRDHVTTAIWHRSDV